MGVEILQLNATFSDDRGAIYELENNRKTNLLLCFRNADTISGRHYHTGISENKNPEIIYLISGEAILRWRTFDENFKEEKVVGPSRISIPIYVWHELKAISPITFIELNSLDDGKKDVARCEF